jgi:SpoVK/Ycf46/Vps4 family AAA+-type ATPase
MNDYVKEAAPAASSRKETSQQEKSSVSTKRDTEAKPDETSSDVSDQNEPEESLEELLENLNSLIGLKAVKQEVQQIINLIKVQKKGEEFGEKLPPLSLHLVFFGNPGTGKTTVARLLAKIYKCLGVLSTGQLVEVDRGGLVAGYVGQTAIKTQEVIDKAMGGILFIDEAYSLTHGKGETDFGQEAVDTILKAMEDHRDDFIVIVAGYPDLMREFVASNPGLKSRFNQFINFEDYTPEELKQIFLFQCKKQGLSLTDECDEYLTQHFTLMYKNRADDYANGRDVRNFFEKVIKARANRLASILDTVTREEYMTIVLSDLQEAAIANKTI